MATPEDIYQVFHRETFFLNKNIYPKKIFNFNKIKEKDYWVYFIKCSDFIKRNNGQIDYKIYIKSLAEFYKGWFNPKHLCSLKSTKIYKNYLEENNKNNSPKFIMKEVLKSIKFVSRYCKENNLKNFSEYLSFQMYLIPPILKHLCSGSISPYFLVCISNIKIILINFPKDCLDEYCEDFFKNFEKYRLRVLNIEKLEQIIKNLNLIIDKLID